ncbi:MAG TPA: phosphoribosylanthranilate isomerase [Kiritimatiellia bacterium]|nr:phosphoribosylanthranilate isomerase [Kiritimatiellia bacterium]HMO98917.1 phosphoribosylanthranilate isomerase [Kiritimatiellia bacterium]HMP95750.1 phosphoribosylanthranilate isomerase [Kiritimatiellia bacterium]
MDLFIKICGISTFSDAAEVAAMKPDALGFVLWPGSPRAVAPEELIRWLPRVRSPAIKVGVFVQPKPEEAVRIARLAGLDVIQVHGEVDVSAYDRAGVRVWRAVHADRLSPLEFNGPRVDAWVADTYSKELPGGTGRVGNWEAVRALIQATAIPVLLAGGLHPGNVREAVRAVHPWGVDVSSGVEKGPGRKDMNKVREFIQQCRTL